MADHTLTARPSNSRARSTAPSSASINAQSNSNGAHLHIWCSSSKQTGALRDEGLHAVAFTYECSIRSPCRPIWHGHHLLGKFCVHAAVCRVQDHRCTWDHRQGPASQHPDCPTATPWRPAPGTNTGCEATSQWLACSKTVLSCARNQRDTAMTSSLQSPGRPLQRSMLWHVMPRLNVGLSVRSMLHGSNKQQKKSVIDKHPSDPAAGEPLV